MVHVTEHYDLKPVAHIETEFPTKFGVPRQSGLVKGLRGRIVFEPEYRDPEALRGLEDYSHIWLLWWMAPSKPPRGETSCPEEHKEGRGESFRPTVRPPRLGGNRRMGVWATRSPFRPNNIGLSSVRIAGIRLQSPDGPVIEVEGADMMDGTPILDIKPYLPFTDSHPDALGGFAEEQNKNIRPLRVSLSEELQRAFDAEHLDALRDILASDPRPHYQDDASRIYGFGFAGKEVKFRVGNGDVEAWL